MRDYDSRTVIFVELFQARRKVHVIAVHGIADPISRAHQPPHYRAGIDAHPGIEGDAVTELDAVQQLLNGKRRPDRVCGVLAVRPRHVEGSEHGIALKLADNAAESGDRLGDQAEVAVQRFD